MAGDRLTLGGAMAGDDAMAGDRLTLGGAMAGDRLTLGGATTLGDATTSLVSEDGTAFRTKSNIFSSSTLAGFSFSCANIKYFTSPSIKETPYGTYHLCLDSPYDISRSTGSSG